VVIPIKYKHHHGWANYVDGFIRVVKQTNKMHIEPIEAISGWAHRVRENAAFGGIGSVWPVNNHIDIDTY